MDEDREIQTSVLTDLIYHMGHSNYDGSIETAEYMYDNGVRASQKLIEKMDMATLFITDYINKSLYNIILL